MKFYEYHNGIIWEYNSIGEFVKGMIGRIIGTFIGLGILFLIMLYFYNKGKGII